MDGEEEVLVQRLLSMTKTKIGLCSVSGCKNKSRRRGLCRKHGPLLANDDFAKIQVATCNECKLPVRCKGLCHIHYNRQWKKKKAKS
jgi:hypothetical protein